jgi:hypothetical protein
VAKLVILSLPSFLSFMSFRPPLEKPKIIRDLNSCQQGRSTICQPNRGNNLKNAKNIKIRALQRLSGDCPKEPGENQFFSALRALSTLRSTTTAEDPGDGGSW